MTRRRRPILQEYAYWILTTHWDLQQGYGPTEPEWTVAGPSELAEAVPSATALIEATVSRTMAGPSVATMDALEAW